MLDVKSLFERNRGNVGREPGDRARKRFAAGEDEVVGVAGVARFCDSCQAGQPRVEPVRDQVGQGRRSGSTLRQVRLAVLPPGPPARGRKRGVELVPSRLVPDRKRNGVGAQAGQQPGDRLGVARSEINRDDPRRW